jgi:uncharacterized protein
VVNVDPRTAARDPIVLRTVARRRQTRMGVYGTTARPGRVVVGDPVVVAALPHPPGIGDGSVRLGAARSG